MICRDVVVEEHQSHSAERVKPRPSQILGFVRIEGARRYGKAVLLRHSHGVEVRAEGVDKGRIGWTV